MSEYQQKLAALQDEEAADQRACMDASFAVDAARGRADAAMLKYYKSAKARWALQNAGDPGT